MIATTDRLALTLPAEVKPSSAVAQGLLIGSTPAQRPPLPASAAAEIAALVALATALGEAPHTVCQLLADNVLALLKAGSAGVSVLSVQSDGAALVNWPAIAGRWQAHSGSSRLLLDPGDLAREATARLPTAVHALIVPFGAAGKTAGTVWAVAHDAASSFGAEDLRQLQDLALFAAPALQALAALRDSAQQHATFNSLIENAPFGVYVVDAQFHLCQASAAARKAFASVQPLIGRNFGEVVRAVWPEPFASEVVARFRHTLESGEAHAEPTVGELRKDTPQIESYDWKIDRVVLPDGGFGVACYFYDQTERQQAAEALRLRTAQFETLFNGAPLGIYLVDADLRVCQVNPQALPEFGNIQGLIGQDLATVMQALWGPTRADDIVQQFRHIVEASPVDRIWGIGMAGNAPGVEDVTAWKGENLLGFALTEVRDRLRRFPLPHIPDDAVLPPWIAHPEIHRYSIGWRMGYGEAHLMDFDSYWQKRHPDERIQLELVYPATGTWSGWYDPMDEDAWKE